MKFVNWTEFPGKKLGDKDTNAVMGEMEGKLRESLDKLKPYSENPKNGLKSQNFVLSGGGYFSMDNPCFTEKGDLLVQLTYNG